MLTQQSKEQRQMRIPCLDMNTNLEDVLVSASATTTHLTQKQVWLFGQQEKAV